jgi:hypothetical protein
MSRVVSALGVLTLATLGCGAPAPQGMSTAPSGFGVVVRTISSGSGNAEGLLPPTQVTLSIADAGAGGGTVEAGSVVLRDAQGSVLAQAVVAAGALVPQGGSGEVLARLEWPAPSGVGSRLDWSLSVRDAHGTLEVLSGTVAYK